MYDFNFDNTHVLTNGVQPVEYQAHGEYVCYEVTGTIHIKYLLILGLSDPLDEERSSFRHRMRPALTSLIFLNDHTEPQSNPDAPVIPGDELLSRIRVHLSSLGDGVSRETQGLSSENLGSEEPKNEKKPRLGSMLVGGTSELHLFGIDALIAHAFEQQQ